MAKMFVLLSLFIGSSCPVSAADTQGLLRSYTSLHKALSADKLSDATAAANKAHTELLAHLKTQPTLSENLSKMKAGIETLAKTKSDEEARKAFGLYSEGVTALIRENEQLKDKWQLFYCPMVPKGIFGYWIQPKGESILNPYYGAKMLTCGVKRPW